MITYTKTRQHNTSYTEIHWPSWTKQFHHFMICGMGPSFTSIKLTCSPVQVHLYSRQWRLPGLSRSLLWSNCATHKIHHVESFIQYGLICDSLNYTPWGVRTSLSRGDCSSDQKQGRTCQTHTVMSDHLSLWPFSVISKIFLEFTIRWCLGRLNCIGM